MTRRDWTPGDDGTEPSLRGVGHPRDCHGCYQDGKPKPRWDHPARSPSVWIFGLVTAAIILLAFAALELGEWIFSR